MAARLEEEAMHPDIIKAIATERVRDHQARASRARRARQVRIQVRIRRKPWSADAG
jgi:hypothetical protein